jgi:hypothetical protein
VPAWAANGAAYDEFLLLTPSFFVDSFFPESDVEDPEPLSLLSLFGESADSFFSEDDEEPEDDLRESLT